MNEINDFYLDERTGKKWIPQRVSESHVYARCDFHGHISHAIFLIQDDGQFGPGNIKRFHSGSMAMTYLRDHSESLPQDYVPSKTRALLETCDPACQEAQERAIREDNTRRYNESKQRGKNFNAGIITEGDE